jgi:Zn-dependent alcohol dehydrogenase
MQKTEERPTVARTTYPAKAFAAISANSGLAPALITRRAPGRQDVQIEILYCGACHSDLHQVLDEACRATKSSAGSPESGVPLQNSKKVTSLQW